MTMSPIPKSWVVIPAAGVGARMAADRPKQYLNVHGLSILEHTANVFLNHPAFEQVSIGLSAEDAYFSETSLANHPNITVFSGGKERSDTVLSALRALRHQANDEDWIWVHDAARPCLSHQEIDDLMAALHEKPSGLVLGVPVSDTLKRVSTEGTNTIAATVDRRGIWRAMTPQIFRYGDLYRALEHCVKAGIAITDEASAMEAIGLKGSMLSGSESNIKVTLPEDLDKVHRYFARGESMSEYPRIGSGFDVHAFGDGDHVTLGGVKIPFEYGLVAHSDGDVLLHALMDAMLGALALGDIGKHFPDTDSKWKGANSRELLRAVNELIHKSGFQVGNLDTTIIAQAPKMAPFIEQMQAHIAEDLGVEVNAVGVKATTTEKLGFTGRKEGIACQASVLLVPVSVAKHVV